MPFLASLSVMLCTAMVLITWSVMGGFSDQVFSVTRTMFGDVAISNPVFGLPYYDELIKALESDAMVAAATPTIESVGLVAIPLPGTSATDPRPLQVIGIEPKGYDRVTGFYSHLWWKHLETPLKGDPEKHDIRLRIPVESKLEEEGKSLSRLDKTTGQVRPGVVIGTQVTPYNFRNPAGFLEPNPNGFGPNLEVTLSVLPLSAKNVVIGLESRKLPVVNEFFTGWYQMDSDSVVMPLDVLQKMLKLDEAQKVEGQSTIVRDAAGRETIRPPRVIGVEPAKVTSILIKAAPGVTPEALRARVRTIYDTFASDTKRTEPMPEPRIYTWDHKPGLETLVAAVKHETGIVLLIFAFISMSAVFLVVSIFWNMVSEKTRDIGILRAMGASKAGVAWIWVRYGLAIGIVGSTLGGVIAYLIIHNINAIHDWLGRVFGVVLWDPSVYYITEIPAKIDPVNAAIVLGAGVLWSAVGAFVPAFRAANMDPVRALRFE